MGRIDKLATNIDPKKAEEIQRSIDEAIKNQEGVTKNKVLASGKLACNAITADRLKSYFL
ncbi:hypothetical protein [Bacillus bingmayongensis]|uniref:hypothetical protein n=1 Tax=Bacillus bingmayongensis TaxID=1150157 RepID=UPI001C8EB6D5|nr:hypothetical protein [Bacillus bingmayongensis]MBY0597680.1 hypothetical protein [Bacillus bingmayongensis]